MTVEVESRVDVRPGEGSSCLQPLETREPKEEYSCGTSSGNNNCLCLDISLKLQTEGECISVVLSLSCYSSSGN